MYRTESPDGHYADQVIATLAHQGCDAVATTQAQNLQGGGKTLRFGTQFAVTEVVGREPGINDTVGYRLGIMLVAQQAGGAGVVSGIAADQFADAPAGGLRLLNIWHDPHPGWQRSGRDKATSQLRMQCAAAATAATARVVELRGPLELLVRSGGSRWRRRHGVRRG